MCVCVSVRVCAKENGVNLHINKVSALQNSPNAQANARDNNLFGCSVFSADAKYDTFEDDVRMIRNENKLFAE